MRHALLVMTILVSWTTGCAQNSYAVRSPPYGEINLQESGVKKMVASPAEVRVFYDTSHPGFYLASDGQLRAREGSKHKIVRRITAQVDGIEGALWRRPLGILSRVTLVLWPLGTALDTPSSDADNLESEQLRALRLMQQKAWEVGANAIVFANMVPSKEGDVSSLRGDAFAVVIAPEEVVAAEPEATAVKAVDDEDEAPVARKEKVARRSYKRGRK